MALFPPQRSHTGGSDSITAAVRHSRQVVATLKAKELRAIAPSRQRPHSASLATTRDLRVTPALFGSVDLPRAPEKPPPSISLLDDNTALWQKVLDKHAAAANPSLASDAHDYKELYLLLLANKSSRRVSAALHDHVKAPLPCYDVDGLAWETEPRHPLILSEHTRSTHARPLSAFANRYGMDCDSIVTPHVTPAPVLDMGLRISGIAAQRPQADRPKQSQYGSFGESRPATAPGSSSTVLERFKMHKDIEAATAAVSGQHTRGPPLHGPATVGEDGTAPVTAFTNHERLRDQRRLKQTRGPAPPPVIPDEALAPIAERLNGDLGRITDQLLRGEKLSAALHKSLTELRRAYHATDAPTAHSGGDRVGSVLQKHTTASADKRRTAAARRPAVTVEAHRLRIGQTQLSPEKTAEIHELRQINPGLATAWAATVRNTQIQGGRLRRASVIFHDHADGADASAANGVERRQHEHFLERPHRGAALEEVMAVHSMKAHVNKRWAALAEAAALAAADEKAAASAAAATAAASLIADVEAAPDEVGLDIVIAFTGGYHGHGVFMTSVDLETTAPPTAGEKPSAAAPAAAASSAAVARPSTAQQPHDGSRAIATSAQPSSRRRPASAPTARRPLPRSGTQRRLVPRVDREDSSRMLEDIDAVNSSGHLRRRAPRKLHRTISADIKPSQGSAAQVMLAMRLRAQLDALSTLHASLEGIERALRDMRLERRLLGLTALHTRFLAVAHAAVQSEVVLDLASLQALAQCLHDSIMALPHADVIKYTEVTLADVDAAAEYLRATAPPSPGGSPGSDGQPPADEFDDYRALRELDALAQQVADAEFCDVDDDEDDSGGRPGQSRSGSSRARMSAMSLRSLSAAHLVKRGKSRKTSAGAALFAQGHDDGASRKAHGLGAASRLSRGSEGSGGGGGGIEIPPAIVAKAEDFAADRLRRSWPTLLRTPMTVLRMTAHWADAAWEEWLGQRGVR